MGANANTQVNTQGVCTPLTIAVLVHAHSPTVFFDMLVIPVSHKSVNDVAVVYINDQ